LDSVEQALAVALVNGHAVRRCTARCLFTLLDLPPGKLRLPHGTKLMVRGTRKSPWLGAKS
jgi:hypothetical protein